MVPKIIVIGLDGATWNLIKPLVDKDKLPTIKKLMEGGCHGKLESSIPHVTFPAWKCYSTGKNPGKLDVYWWMNVDLLNRRFRVNISSSFKGKEIWDILATHRYKSGVIGMPTTYPTKKINGFMVSEMNPKNANYTYPHELSDELNEMFDYESEFVDFHGKNKDEVVQSCNANILKRFEIADYLVNRFKPEFLNLTIFPIDAIQHFYWKYMEDKDTKYANVIEKSWMLIDENINKFLKKYADDDTNIILMSDHGFTAFKGMFNINKWLVDNGYLVLSNNKSFKNIIYKTAYRCGIRGSMVDKFKTLPIINNIVNDAKSLVADVSESLIDWERSKVIPLPEGILYINKYLFNNGKYRSVVKELKREISLIENPTNGEKLAKKIYHKSELYNGKFIDNAPDIIILPNEGYEIQSRFDNTTWNFSSKEDGWSGVHKLHGIFLAHGPDIKQNTTIEGTRIIDLAPTILHMYGVPIPRDMDGRVLTEIFRKDSEMAKRKVVYEDDNTRIDKERIRIKSKIKKIEKI